MLGVMAFSTFAGKWGTRSPGFVSYLKVTWATCPFIGGCISSWILSESPEPLGSGHLPHVSKNQFLRGLCVFAFVFVCLFVFVFFPIFLLFS